MLLAACGGDDDESEGDTETGGAGGPGGESGGEPRPVDLTRGTLGVIATTPSGFPSSRVTSTT